MTQNGNPGPSPRRPGSRTILTIVLALVALIIGTGSVVAYFTFNHTQGNTPPTQTASATVHAGNNGNAGNNGGACNQNSPYGFTTIHANSQLVSMYKQLNVCWVRYQVHWGKRKKTDQGIETSPGVYNWSQVDAAVAAMNAAHIYIDFPIQQAPSWDMTQTCDGKPFLPGPTQMSTFASLLATRYNGKNGHGYINAFEIGNEEYDNFYIKGDPASLQCRNASYYGPVLQAGYEAIKQASPHALVGMFGMWYHNLPHIQSFMTYLYSNGYGKYMDYMNFHYYNDAGSPAISQGDRPSFDQWWQTMHTVAAKYGFANKPIWVTETGWPTTGFQSSTTVTPQVQANNMQYIYSQAAASKVIQKVFWFTINYGKQSDNIYPPGGPLPSFYTYQKIVQQHSGWN